MILPTTEVQYTCHLCGLIRIPVDVRARQCEDLHFWLMSIMAPTLVADHEQRSPNCHPKSFSEVMIPYDGTTQVGGAVQN